MFKKHLSKIPAFLLMVLTLVAILFLGGIAGMLANAQVSVRWGAVAGLVSAIAVSFGVGYLVRVGMGLQTVYGTAR